MASEKSPIESSQSMQRPKLSDMEIITGQRNSLPDITTTPKDENGQFFTTSSHNVRTSHSIENILHDDVNLEPPPKPSRINLTTPPSIPPKKPRDSVDNSSNNINNVFNFNTMKASLERSKSPDLNSSTGSTGSTTLLDNGFEDAKFDFNSSFNMKTMHMVESKSSSSSMEVNRTSNESGFGSITSGSNIFKTHETIMENKQMIHHDEKVIDKQLIVISSPLQDGDFKYVFDKVEERPPLPIKTKSRKSESQGSFYDNVELNGSNLSVVTTSSSNTSISSSSTITSFSNAFSSSQDFQHHQIAMKNKYFSCFEPRNLMHDEHGADGGSEEKPPLPPKKNKHSEYYFKII